MKQFYFALIFVFVANIGNAQTLYQQDFSDGFGDMILIDNDKKVPAANVSTYTMAWNIRDNFFNRVGAVSNSWYAPVGRADDWMITPVITGMNELTVLEWKAAAIDASFPNGYEVYVSPNGGATIADFTDKIFAVGGENPELTVRVISLAAYKGNSIRIAFRDISNDMFLLFVDDIIVKDLSPKDVAVISGTSNQFIAKGNIAYPSFTIKNVGIEQINSIGFTWTDGNETYEETLSNLELNSADEYTIELAVGIDEAKKYTFGLEVVNINGELDPIAVNNSGTAFTIGVEKEIKRKLVAEEGTGTWCQWCPRGAVNMELMEHNNPTDFIGIAVHNADPMTLNAYDSGLTSFPGFSGFPGVVVNRESVIDPGDLPTYFAQVTSKEFTALEVNIGLTRENRKITVDADVEFFADLEDIDYSVVAVLVENEVKGTGTTYAQANSYAGGNFGPMGGYESLANPVPASQMVYQDVARALPFGFAGRNTIIPDSVKNGDSYIFSFSSNTPSTQKIENMKAVVFVVDNATGAIVAAGETETFLVNNEDIKELNTISIVPNPAVSEAYVKVDLNTASEINMEVYNNMGQRVAQKNYGKLVGSQYLPINLSNFQSGMYIVKTSINGKIVTDKLIVE